MFNQNQETRDSDKEQKAMKGKKLFKRKIVAALVLIVLFVTVGFADIPVIDMTVNTTLHLNFLKTIEQLVTEYKHLLEVQQYRVLINGHWPDPLKITEVVKTTAASLGIPIKDLGWDKDARFRKEPATQIAAEALDELHKMMTAQQEQDKLSNTRGNIEEVYGDVPVTRAGASVESAYREMAETAAFNGESEKAIEELLKNADKIKEKIDRGGLPPGDLERMQVEEADLRFRAQILQTKALNQSNRLSFQQVGMKAAEEGRLERSRLKDTYQRFEVMKSVMFSPAVIEEDEGEE